MASEIKKACCILSWDISDVQYVGLYEICFIFSPNSIIYLFFHFFIIIIYLFHFFQSFELSLNISYSIGIRNT